MKITVYHGGTEIGMKEVNLQNATIPQKNAQAVDLGG